jgi:hypothetical protein
MACTAAHALADCRLDRGDPVADDEQIADGGLVGIAVMVIDVGPLEECYRGVFASHIAFASAACLQLAARIIVSSKHVKD